MNLASAYTQFHNELKHFAMRQCQVKRVLGTTSCSISENCSSQLKSLRSIAYHMALFIGNSEIFVITALRRHSKVHLMSLKKHRLAGCNPHNHNSPNARLSVQYTQRNFQLLKFFTVNGFACGFSVFFLCGV